MLARRLTPLRVAALILGALALVPAARAGAPPPLSNPTYGFPLPGDYAAAANAASAGLALSHAWLGGAAGLEPGGAAGPGGGGALPDRWLGESAYETPAASVRSGVEISPLFQRVNRQDLAAKNRDVDQTFGYPDAAGGALSLPGKHWDSRMSGR